MSACGCGEVYLSALKVFLQVLNVQYHRELLHLGFRQYMHRMVLCLEDEILPTVPEIFRQLLDNQDAKALIDFIPFFNQINSKFKERLGPFLRDAFMSVVRAVFQVLNQQQQNNNSNANSGGLHDDEDLKETRRTYFTYLHSLVTNNLSAVITEQSKADFDLILQTLVQGIMEYNDAVGRKAAFAIMLQMVTRWDGDAERIWEICRDNFIPVCFGAPLAANFDLADAQTVLSLYESCKLMKMILKTQGDKLEAYLRDIIFPSTNISNDCIQEYCEVLRNHDDKTFRNYSKALFNRMKSS